MFNYLNYSGKVPRRASRARTLEGVVHQRGGLGDVLLHRAGLLLGARHGGGAAHGG